MMGAFDGLIPRSYLRDHSVGGYTSKETPVVAEQPTYIRAQSHFNFFKGFGIDEFEKLVARAVQNNSDTVWVPSERMHQGRIGISTWYAQVLLNRLHKGMPI